MTAAAAPNSSWQLGYRPALDGVRGIAILLVLASHTRVPGLPDGGTIGVTLFFVLSGFLITGLLIGERQRTGTIDFRAFYARRARRLFPALGAFLVVIVILLVASKREELIPGTVLPIVFYVSNWWNAMGGHSMPGAGLTWSLAVEEQFYILWPLAFVGIAALTRGGLRRAMWIVLAITIALMAWRFMVWPFAIEPSDRVKWGTDTRGDAILLGCAIAFAAASGVRLRWAPVFGIFALAGLILLGAQTDGRVLGPLTLTFAAILSALLIASVESWSPRWLTWRPLMLLGMISYALYLWQGPTVTYLRTPMQDLLGVPLAAAALFGIALALAALSWRFIESPFLGNRARRFRPEKAPHPTKILDKVKATESEPPMTA